jgi:hypothetical protein
VAYVVMNIAIFIIAHERVLRSETHIMRFLNIPLLKLSNWFAGSGNLLLMIVTNYRCCRLLQSQNSLSFSYSEVGRQIHACLRITLKQTILDDRLFESVS